MSRIFNTEPTPSFAGCMAASSADAAFLPLAGAEAVS